MKIYQFKDENFRGIYFIFSDSIHSAINKFINKNPTKKGIYYIKRIYKNGNTSSFKKVIIS